jgi:XTP/dITP diphosphohydrolase
VTRVLLASNNKKKLEELRRILTPIVPGIEVLGLGDVPPYDEPAETEPTFEGNALLKAHAALAATGLPSIADDSGICVDALNGMPGVLSARWSGTSLGSKKGQDDRNNELLLQQLADVPDERRGAHFACAVAFVHAGGEEVVEGRMPGHVIRELRGSGGFGYDVLFVADEHAAEGLTSAELAPAEKDRISHRGRALREIAPRVAKVVARG